MTTLIMDIYNNESINIEQEENYRNFKCIFFVKLNPEGVMRKKVLIAQNGISYESEQNGGEEKNLICDKVHNKAETFYKYKFGSFRYIIRFVLDQNMNS